MAATSIRYKGRLVQVPESSLTIVGYMLFHEASVSASTPVDELRFKQMARDFEVRTIGVGCTDLGLDELLQGDPQKEREFLSFVGLARERISQLGEALTADYLDQFMPIPEYRGKRLASPWFRKVLDIIEALIRGQQIPSV